MSWAPILFLTLLTNVMKKRLQISNREHQEREPWSIKQINHIEKPSAESRPRLVSLPNGKIFAHWESCRQNQTFRQQAWEFMNLKMPASCWSWKQLCSASCCHPSTCLNKNSLLCPARQVTCFTRGSQRDLFYRWVFSAKDVIAD